MSKSKLKTWEDFMKLAKEAIAQNEDLRDFKDRMEYGGFQLSYQPPIKEEVKKAAFVEIITFLNITTDQQFPLKYGSGNSEIIAARLKEGYTVQVMKEVVQMLYGRWRDTSMMNSLRPDVIFKSNKLENYIGQLPKKPKTNPGSIEIKPVRKVEEKIDNSERNAAAMKEMIEEVQQIEDTTDILNKSMYINMVWGHFKKIQKTKLGADTFAAAEEYGKRMENPDIPDSDKVYMRHYCLKVIFNICTLAEILSWVHPQDFIKVEQ